MVMNFLGALASGSIRSLAQAMFAGFYERGISANQALTELRGLGLGYRRQDFLNDFRVGESQYTQQTRVRFIGKNTVPSDKILLPKYHGVEDKYSFVFKATGINTSTGEPTEQYFFYHRNSLATRQQMEQEAQDWIESQSEQYGIEIDSVSIREGYINPPLV